MPERSGSVHKFSHAGKGGGGACEWYFVPTAKGGGGGEGNGISPIINGWRKLGTPFIFARELETGIWKFEFELLNSFDICDNGQVRILTPLSRLQLDYVTYHFNVLYAQHSQ